MEARAKRLLCHSYGNTTRGSIIKLISSEKYGVLLSDLHVATADSAELQISPLRCVRDAISKPRETMRGRMRRPASYGAISFSAASTTLTASTTRLKKDRRSGLQLYDRCPYALCQKLIPDCCKPYRKIFVPEAKRLFHGPEFPVDPYWVTEPLLFSELHLG